jgi:Lipase (class 3)
LRRSCRDQCVADGLSLVFTGHSQGGAVASIGHLAYASSGNVQSITFGAAPVFSGSFSSMSEVDPCPYVQDVDILRFINTENDDWGFHYDVIALVDWLMGDLMTAQEDLIKDATLRLFTSAIEILVSKPFSEYIAQMHGVVGRQKAERSGSYTSSTLFDYFQCQGVS